MKLAIAFSIALLSRNAAAQDIDILRQEVTVDVSSSTVTGIGLRADIAVDGPTTEIWMFTFPLPVASLAIDGVEVSVRNHPQYPGIVDIVELPRAYEAGETLSLALDAAGELPCNSRLDPGRLACVRNADETVLVPSSPDVGWYLINLFRPDTFVGSITVRAPSHFEVQAGQGSAKEVQNQGGLSIARFEFDVPTESLPVYAGRASRVEAAGVQGIYTGDHREKMQIAVDLASQVVPLYEERFGPLAVDETTLVSIPRGFAFGGLGLIGTVFFGDYVVGELDYLLHQGVAHELGHTWWGGLTSSSNSEAAGFFNEAFAEYSAWWALGQIQGEAARASGNRMNAVWYMYARPNVGDVAVLDPAVRDSPYFVFVTYHKASVVLRTFEAAMGEAAFTTALRSMVGRGPGGTDVDTFLEDLADAGYDASRDVEQWLRTTGFPRVAVKAARSASKVALTLEVEGDFDFALPARAFQSDGAFEERRLPVGPGANGYEVEDAPVLIQLDPDWTAVREIRADGGDVSFDGTVDGIDLIEVALRLGGHMPSERRRDGGFDPLYDLNSDQRIDDEDLQAIIQN